MQIAHAALSGIVWEVARLAQQVGALLERERRADASLHVLFQRDKVGVHQSVEAHGLRGLGAGGGLCNAPPGGVVVFAEGGMIRPDRDRDAAGFLALDADPVQRAAAPFLWRVARKSHLHVAHPDSPHLRAILAGWGAGLSTASGGNTRTTPPPLTGNSTVQPVAAATAAAAFSMAGDGDGAGIRRAPHGRWACRMPDSSLA